MPQLDTYAFQLVSELADGSRLVQPCVDEKAVITAILSLSPFVPAEATWHVEPNAG